jgi:protein TonB
MIRPPHRRFGDCLAAAVSAAAFHGAFFACGGFGVRRSPPVVAPPAARSEPDAEVALFAVERCEAAPVPGNVEVEPVREVGDSSEPAADLIGRSDLCRDSAVALPWPCLPLGRVAGGVGFRVDRDVLAGVGGGRCLRSFFELAELDQPPVIIAQSLPPYPSALLRTGASGEVTVMFIVTPEGGVRSARVTAATNSGFAESALEAVARWRFWPGRKDGRSVDSRVEVPIAFAVPACA